MKLFRHILVGLLGREVGPSQILYLHRTAQKGSRRHTSMTRARFETMTNVRAL